MRNVGAPIFIHLGNRMRGPKGIEVGKIQNVLIENGKAILAVEKFFKKQLKNMEKKILKEILLI